MNPLDIYCVTNKQINFLRNSNYKMAWVGQAIPPKNYIACDNKNNIFHKEKYYSELTFHYWYWKNLLDINSKNWVGFCQRRRFWIKKSSENQSINVGNFKDHFLTEVDEKWDNYDAIICSPINVNNVKKTKLIKRGFKSLLKNPSIFFNVNKQTLSLHFDMHHGYGNLKKAIKIMNKEDQNEFEKFVNNSIEYNPHIMFIAKTSIVNKWFTNLFPWLFECEKIFGFEKLEGYETQRLYAYLAERYLSFWFRKYTKYLEWPWVFLNEE